MLHFSTPVMPEPDVAFDLRTIDENDAIDIALLPTGELDEHRVVASSRRLKELARSQLDEEGENSSLFGDMCDKLFWKYREYGYGVLDNDTVPIPSYVPLGTLGTPMDEQDRGYSNACVIERIKTHGSAIGTVDLFTIGAGRSIKLREKRLYARGTTSSCATFPF